MTKTRIYAVTCLADILRRGDRPKQSLVQFADSLDRRDRAFLMEIVYGVLRNLYVLDHVIASYIANTRSLSESTKNNLRVAAYQLLFMRVPGYAVVNESVEIEKKGGKPSLVNAVLRNIIRSIDSISLKVSCSDAAEEISINTSHQKWMVKRWIDRFGTENARLFSEANNMIPPLVIRTNTLRISRDELLQMINKAGMTAEPTIHSPDGIALGSSVSYNDLSVFEGLFAVQDEASQMVSYLLSPEKGEKILDACAAPGGKTTHIAQMMSDEGEITAVEREQERLPMLKAAINSLSITSAKIIRADVSRIRDIGPFDRILLDAPCSSIGVIRRNPDVKFRHSIKDLSSFGKKQLNLLKAVSPLTKPGGRLVYSVCSTEPEEGEEVVRDFLKTNDEFRIIEADQEFMRPFITDGCFRTFPHLNNMDGFFGVILCRKT